jgi:hypothetical protein
MLPHNIYRLLVHLAVAASLGSANANPTQESKAEAALAGKINCDDFRKNPWHLDQWTHRKNRQQSLFQPHF